MGRKSLISPDVINSDEFLGMGIEARELYQHLLTNADPIGAVTGVMGIARGCGYQDPEPIIGELVASRHLVEARADDGKMVYFISHWYTHNNRDRNREGRSRSAYIRLAERIFPDPYAPYRTCEEKPSTVEDEPSQGRQPLREFPPNAMQGNATEGNATEKNGIEVNEKEWKGGGSLKGEPPDIPCPDCGHETLQGGVENGYAHIECARCGLETWINPETGELKDNPYQ